MADNCTPFPTPFSLSQSYDPSSGESNDYFKPNHHLQRSVELTAPNAGVARPNSRNGIDGIPNEVPAHVFELGYFGVERDDSFRTSVLQVSRRFCNVIAETPSVWSSYMLSQGNVQQYLPVLPLHLQRSKGYPLDIVLNCFWSSETTDAVMGALIPHSQRWRQLTITTPNTDIFSFLTNTPVPTLESVTLAHFSSERRLALPHAVFNGGIPKLSNLILRNVSLDRININLHHLTKLELRGYGRWPQYSELCAMLGGSQSLEQLVLHVKPTLALEDIRQGGEPPIPLPALRIFNVFSSEMLTGPIAELVQTFHFPNIATLSVQEGPSHTAKGSSDYMRYTTSPQPTLFVNLAPIEHAWRCLSPEQSASLKVLELRRPDWPPYNKVMQIFSSLTSLDRLAFTGLTPSDIIEQLKEATHPESRIPVVSLKSFELHVVRNFWSPQNRDVSRFFRLFHLPAITSLTLSNLCLLEWNNILAAFDDPEAVSEYPLLTSLTLTNIHNLTVGEGNDDTLLSKPVSAFSNLQHLTLLNVPDADRILRRLLNPSDKVIWPDLQGITLWGETRVRRPLLHDIIKQRRNLGRPLLKLFLDEGFGASHVSWEWIKEHVQVVEG